MLLAAECIAGREHSIHIHTGIPELKVFNNLVDVKYDFNEIAFSYQLKHKAIQRRTNRMGYTIQFTNTRLKAEEVFRIYREKDIVEKAFSHIKPHL